MTRGLGRLVLLVALLLQAPAVLADNKTYCVGGFEFTGGLGFIPALPSRQQCETHKNVHKRWHFHCFVKGPDGKCRECWDEQDDTCDISFLRRDHPEFQRIDPFSCVRAGALPPEGEEIRVERGEVIRPSRPPGPAVNNPPPPPPPPTDVRAEIMRISPGPYAVGDKVRVDAHVIGADGKPRPVQGGEIIVRGPDGTEKMRVPVQAGPDDTATAEVPIPSGGDISLEFQPGGVKVGANERLGSVTPRRERLSVSPCRLRGAVLAPAEGEVVVAGVPIGLRGQIQERGAAAGKNALAPGTRAVFVIDLGRGKTHEIEATLDASGSATATLTLSPPAEDSTIIAVRFLGQGGAGDFCPGAPVALHLTKLGVGLDITEPAPDGTCYVGRPCRVAVRFLLPSSGVGQGPAEAFVRAPDLKVSALLNAEPLGALQQAPGPSTESAPRHAMTFVPGYAGLAEIEITASAGGQQIAERRRFRIREPIVLKLPGELHLGAFAAGTATREACGTLDFSASRGVEEQEFLLQVKLPPGCRSTLGIMDDHGGFFPLTEDRKLTLGVKRKLTLCLDVPRCAGDDPAPVPLSIRPTSPDFPGEQATVGIRWRVTGRSFLSCHLWWIAILGAGALFLFLVYGFVSPYPFGADDAVKIATQQQGLQRAVARRLRGLPGGRTGFYRSAATGLREDGAATDKLRSAAIVLLASRGEVVLRCRGGLSRYNPQTRKLEPVALGKDGKQGYAASKNVIYQAGSLFFQVS